MLLPILTFCFIGCTITSPTRQIFQPLPPHPILQTFEPECRSQHVFAKPSLENPHSILPGASQINQTFGHQTFCQTPPSTVPASTFADCALLTTFLPTMGINDKFSADNPDPNYRLPWIRQHSRCCVVVEFRHDATVLADQASWLGIKCDLQDVFRKCVLMKHALGFARLGQHNLIEAGFWEVDGVGGRRRMGVSG